MAPRRSPQWLVQVRQHGEAWRTVHAVNNADEAGRLATGLAAEDHNCGGVLVPRWPYIRLSHRLYGVQVVR